MRLNGCERSFSRKMSSCGGYTGRNLREAWLWEIADRPEPAGGKKKKKNTL
jgi:hypothetical protein